MDRALDEVAEKDVSSVGVHVDEGALRGTVAAVAVTVAPALATVVAVVNPVAEEEEEEDVYFFDSQENLLKHLRARNLKEVVAFAPELQPVVVEIDDEEVDSEADPLHSPTAEKVKATDVVAPQQLPVVDVPGGSYVLPGKDGEDVASDADLRQNASAEKVTVTPAVAPQQLPVDDVPEDTGPLPRYDGEDIKQYDFDDSVDEDNKASFGQHIHKKLDGGDLNIGGVYKNGKEWFTCPFCPNKPADGLWNALAQHGQSLPIWGKTMKIRVQHNVLTEFMCGGNRPNVEMRADKRRKVF